MSKVRRKESEVAIDGSILLKNQSREQKRSLLYNDSYENKGGHYDT